MAKPKALILTGYGINCDYETEFAFRLAGGESERVHINDLIDGHRKLTDYQILAFPGGFSFGDDIAAGRVFANKCRTNLGDELKRFVEGDKLAIGICNGFQVMIKCGLLPGGDPTKGEQAATLGFNDSGRFEDRWVHLKPVSDKCVFTQGIEALEVPVAHGEGKFIAPDEVIEGLWDRGQVVLQYANDEGGPASGSFPQNPNGSVDDIAGLCDASGRLFGLMPHPERYLSFTNHPHWTRIKDELRRAGKPIPEEGAGLNIFRNAVGYFS